MIHIIEVARRPYDCKLADPKLYVREGNQAHLSGIWVAVPRRLRLVAVIAGEAWGSTRRGEAKEECVLAGERSLVGVLSPPVCDPESLSLAV